MTALLLLLALALAGCWGEVRVGCRERCPDAGGADAGDGGEP